MGDDGSRSIGKSLKKEWALFLEAFQGEEDPEADSESNLENSKIEPMSLERVREITKTLVEDRKRLNQNLELVSKELDISTTKLENLRLVGGDVEETLNRIHELNDLGQSISEALARIDEKLREARSKELELQEDFLEISG